jgi:Dolichyl-phosphate-mannose-protein mannosyltransferase
MQRFSRLRDLLTKAGAVHHKTPSRGIRKAIQWPEVAMMVAGLAVLLTAYDIVMPRYGNVMQRDNDGPQVEAELPMRFDSGNTRIDKSITFDLKLGVVAPRRYHIVPDDCLESLVINGEEYDGEIPFCDFSKGRIVDLGGYLQRGTNTIEARIRNDGGPGAFDFGASWRDPSLLALFAAIALVPILYGILLLYRMKASSFGFSLYGLFLLGTAIRVYYTAITPHWIRGHDTDGHIEYIRHIVDHWWIPRAGEGWESWQPPLYYAVSAIVMGVGRLLEWSEGAILKLLQQSATLASAVTLLIAMWILRLAFPERKQSATVLLGTALFAVFPGLIFNAARINNDVLAVVLAFLTVGLLLKWWSGGRMWWFHGSAIVTALHMLTKGTAPLFVPVMYGMLFFKRGVSWKKKILHGAIALVTMALLYGWLPVARYVQGSMNESYVGNIGSLNDALRVDNDVRSYLTFNPVATVRIPYNNAWEDSARRNNFWEYWYRSAFFGEFDHGADRKLVAQWILALSYLLFPLALLGLFVWFRKDWYRALPMGLLLVVLPLGHAVFRFQFPFSSSQDFRYSLAALIPWFCFALKSLDILPAAAQKGLRWMLQLFCALCVIFILSL